ncbi:MAG: hypothetical protein A3C53_06280 [Omnitrophica WOR_2 bacterium RIFCSPHIGHO2_02_FULL_68_15]|nr:MAG: hypothetical protein A3C53_06280 [Omnitrophica WOR_2 bacterium RIFCSPHIGHO2_02_FULL_68_15]
MTKPTLAREPDDADGPGQARRLKLVTALGGALGACGAMVLMVGIREPAWVLGALAALVGIGTGIRGLWRFRRWALYLSWMLAAAALAVGCYWAHFAWTFWLFTEPTPWDRVRAVLNPLILLWLGGPAAWLWYFTRRRVIDRFEQ